MESWVESSESDSEKSSESEEETSEEDVALEAFISKASVEENYKLMERTVTPEKSPLVLSKLRLAHPEAFSPESEKALASAVNDLSLPFPLSDFQTFSTVQHELCTGHTLKHFVNRNDNIDTFGHASSLPEILWNNMNVRPRGSSNYANVDKTEQSSKTVSTMPTHRNCILELLMGSLARRNINERLKHRQ